MKKIATDYNFQLNEIKEARIWTVATDPILTDANKGAILYNSTDNVGKFCTGNKLKEEE